MAKNFWLSFCLVILFAGGVAVLAISQMILPSGVEKGIVHAEDTVSISTTKEEVPPKNLTDEERLLAAAEGIPLGEVIMVEDESVKPGVAVGLKYDLYHTTDIYFVVSGKVLSIKEEPGDEKPVIAKLYKNDKLNYLETVILKISSQDGSGYDMVSHVDSENQDEEELYVMKWVPQRWYHVTWKAGGKDRYGFIREDQISKRLFQYDKMEKAFKNLEAYVITGRVTYVSNYKNRRGMAPLWNGKTIDARGTGRSQSVPGYFNSGNHGDFVYLEDGTLVQMQSVVGEQIRVKVLQSGETLYVPIKYITDYQSLDRLMRVVIVDRNYQNEGVYEKIDGEWTLVSKSLATTGTTGPYSQPTPLGYYYAMEKRSQFLYLKDGTNEVEGYAPYAVRFCGGAYIHGVPVGYIFRDEERITPGIREYSKTIGTVPLSHKCVRNYTSHAKFLYEWYTPHETAIIVIE